MVAWGGERLVEGLGPSKGARGVSRDLACHVKELGVKGWGQSWPLAPGLGAGRWWSVSE